MCTNSHPSRKIYGFDATGINILGRTGAEVAGGAAGGAFTAFVNGEDVLNGLGYGALNSLHSALWTSTVNMVYDGASYDGSDISTDNAVKYGDVVVFGRDGSLTSGVLSWLTGESYTHAALVDRDDDRLFIRESNNRGEEVKTLLTAKEYTGRPYKILGNRTPLRNFKPNGNGYGILGRNLHGSDMWNGYNLVETNCTSQVTRWTGMRYVNNPGTLARTMGGAPYSYMHSTSLQGVLW